MGKIGGNSWFTAVKRAFLSPSKDNEKSSRREDHEPEEEEKVNFFLFISFVNCNFQFCFFFFWLIMGEICFWVL